MMQPGISRMKNGSTMGLLSPPISGAITALRIVGTNNGATKRPVQLKRIVLLRMRICGRLARTGEPVRIFRADYLQLDSSIMAVHSRSKNGVASARLCPGHPPSSRAQAKRSRRRGLDCFVALLLAMTRQQRIHVYTHLSCRRASIPPPSWTMCEKRAVLLRGSSDQARSEGPPRGTAPKKLFP